MPRLTIRLDQATDRGVTTLCVGGELDMCTSSEISERLGELVSGGTRLIALDLAAVDLIDSFAMSMLVRWHEDIRALRGAMRIVQSSPAVDRMLGLLRLHFMRYKRG